MRCYNAVNRWWLREPTYSPAAYRRSLTAMYERVLGEAAKGSVD
jgi:hypothetical protein